jgi:hypothetical protein
VCRSSAVARGADAAHERKRAIGPRTRRPSTLNGCTTSRTAGPHGDPCQRIGKQAYEHLLLCGRFFQRNGAIGRLELSTTRAAFAGARRRWSAGVQHADGQTPLSAERRTPSPEREAAISLAAGARARSAHAIGAERIARGDAGNLGQHPAAEPPAVRSGCPTCSCTPAHDWEAPAS